MPPHRKHRLRWLLLVEAGLFVVAGVVVASILLGDSTESRGARGFRVPGWPAGFEGCACSLDGSLQVEFGLGGWRIDGEFAPDPARALRDVSRRMQADPEGETRPGIEWVRLHMPDFASAEVVWNTLRTLARNLPPNTLGLEHQNARDECRWSPLLLADPFEMHPEDWIEDWTYPRLFVRRENDSARLVTDLPGAVDGEIEMAGRALVDALHVCPDEVLVEVDADVPFSALCRLAGRFDQAEFTFACYPTREGAELKFFAWPRATPEGRAFLAGLRWATSPAAGPRVSLHEETVDLFVAHDGARLLRHGPIVNLEDYLRTRANTTRDPEPPMASRAFLGLTVDARTPWREIRPILRTAAHRDVRIRRLFWNVRVAPDGPPGRIHAVLPGLEESRRATHRIELVRADGTASTRVILVTRELAARRDLGAADAGFAALAPALEALLETESAVVTLAAADPVPFGDVATAMSALLEATGDPVILARFAE